MKELVTIGISDNPSEIDSLVRKGQEWTDCELSRRQPRLDLYGEHREACEHEQAEVDRVLSNISNILRKH